MEKTKLSAMPYAQAYVLKDFDGNITLVSYQTCVAVITAAGWLIIKGLYSATTRRHIGAFVKEYAGISYETAKWLYLDDEMLNVHTGEVLPIMG